MQPARTMRLATDSSAASSEEIRVAVAWTGLRPDKWRADNASTSPSDEQRRVETALTAAGVGFLLLGLALHVWLIGSIRAAIAEGVGRIVPWPAVAAYGAVIILGARHVVVMA